MRATVLIERIRAIREERAYRRYVETSLACGMRLDPEDSFALALVQAEEKTAASTPPKP